MERLTTLEVKIMDKIEELEEAVKWASRGYTEEEVLAILKELLE